MTSLNYFNDLWKAFKELRSRYIKRVYYSRDLVGSVLANNC